MWASPAAGQGYREAEIEFNRGELLLEMRDYPRAIFAFKKAYSFLPDIRYLAGLVRAYNAKGDQERALVHGEDYLLRAGDSPNERVVSIVRNLREQVGQQAGKVEIALQPTGGKLTQVFPDGNQKVRVAGEAKLTTWLPTGKNVLVYAKDGYTEKKTEVVVEAGKSYSADLLLERAKGQAEVVINSSVQKSVVYLDGKEVGRTPLKARVPAGDHVVQVWAQNHLAWTGVIDAPAARAVSVNAVLVPSTSQVASLPTPQVVMDESGIFLADMSFWGWVNLVSGVAQLGGAVYFYLDWSKNYSAALELSNLGQPYADKLADAENSQMWMWIVGASGILQVAGGLVMIIADRGDDLEGAASFELLSISPTVLPNGMGLNAMFTF